MGCGRFKIGLALALAATPAASADWEFARLPNGRNGVQVNAIVISTDGSTTLGFSCLNSGKGPLRALINSRRMIKVGFVHAAPVEIAVDRLAATRQDWAYLEGAAYTDGVFAIALARRLRVAEVANITLKEVAQEPIRLTFRPPGGAAPIAKVLAACRIKP